jgi:hypothetical protein
VCKALAKSPSPLAHAFTNPIAKDREHKPIATPHTLVAHDCNHRLKANDEAFEFPGGVIGDQAFHAVLGFEQRHMGTVGAIDHTYTY